MRMRKLPWAQEYIDHANVVIKDPTQLAGKWKEYLQCHRLHVEIGSGKGEYWTTMAHMYQNEGWLAIEKQCSVAAVAIKKYDTFFSHLKNTAFIYQDAQNIEFWFQKHEINVIHLNFSDPWPKKRAFKKRLSNHRFIQAYSKILDPLGEIQMKTDNATLFEYSLLEFEKENWILDAVSVDYRRITHEEDAISEYERKFMDKGNPIYRAVWKQRLKKS